MTNLPKAIGHSTLQVGRIGLGCMGMSEFYSGTRDEADLIKILHTAIDLGINHFDTAEELTGIRSRLPQETAGSRY